MTSRPGGVYADAGLLPIVLRAGERCRILRPGKASAVRAAGGFAMPRLYAAGPNAVAVVEDGSARTALEGRGAQSLAGDPKDPDTLYVGTSDEGLFKSADGGTSWEKLPGIEHPRVTAVAVAPTDGAVYAGTEPSALFVSRDG